MGRARGSTGGGGATAGSTGGGGATAGSAELRRSLLQILLSRKVMPKADLEAALGKINADARGPVDVKACLSELNKELRPCHFEIRGLHEDGKEIYGIVNTSSDEVAKSHASRMKDWEKAFFKEIIKTLCENENGGVDKQDMLGLKIAQGGTQASQKEKELTFSALVSDMWLRRDHRDRVFLGPRTMLELGDIVRSFDLEPPQIIFY